MLAGQLLIHFIFQQTTFSEKIVDIIGISVMFALIWWFVDWSKPKNK
jgi:hypothetical protein